MNLSWRGLSKVQKKYSQKFPILKHKELQLKYAVTLSCLLYLNNERSDHISTDTCIYWILCLHFWIFTVNRILRCAEGLAAFRYHPLPLVALSCDYTACLCCTYFTLHDLHNPPQSEVLFPESCLLLACGLQRMLHCSQYWCLALV